MTREETLKAAIKAFESTKDPSKPHPQIDHYAIQAFWESRAKAKETWYKKSRGIQ